MAEGGGLPPAFSFWEVDIGKIGGFWSSFFRGDFLVGILAGGGARGGGSGWGGLGAPAPPLRENVERLP